MTFAFPWALAGLALAAIPIVLHLIARREPPTVLFPATRYLADATRLHQRRLQLQNLLLLAVRTLLIAAVMLAAAGPRWPRASLGTHSPTAVVLIVDNSLSSGAIRGGVPVLDGLRRAGRAVLAQASADDRLWLLTADGVPRAGSASGLASRVDSLVVAPARLDLGVEVVAAAGLLKSADRAGEIIVVSDFQRSAMSGGRYDGPITALRPAGDPPLNAGIAALAVGSQPWGQDGGNVAIRVGGTGERARPVSIATEGRPSRQLLVPVGGTATQRLAALPPGWRTVTAELDPDELRLDDRRVVAVRVAPPARVAVADAGTFVTTAVQVLEQNGRLAAGTEVSLGTLGATASVVLPPADPARLGAVNRALAARGSSWRFGDPAITATATDSGPWLGRERVQRRYRLVHQGGAPTDVLVTAGGEPWVARSGRTVLVGSRFEPDWTGLPLSAGFLPFLDALVNRAARGELIQLEAAPGDRILVPDRVTAVVAGDRRWPIEGGSAFRPTTLGPHFLLVDRDTVGSISVNPDQRESELAPASVPEMEALWPKVRIADLARAGAVAFQSGATSDLRGPLLILAVTLLLLEIILAAGLRRRTG